MDGLDFACIVEKERLTLEKEFTKEEVIQVLREMEDDKAPGPNGFTMAFFHNCWSVVEKDVMDFFDYFHQHSVFERSLNVSFLIQFLRRVMLLTLWTFRPISFVSSVYKLLSKVLANRLRAVLDKLISESQNSFVGGRKMSVVCKLDSRLKS